MLCISRYADNKYAEHFGDGRHKFYFEFRCNRPCIINTNYCSTCTNKSDSAKIQHLRKFNHGCVNEPIPDNSHIFGGKWYYTRILKWGPPPSEVIEFAMQYQNNARRDFIEGETSMDNVINSNIEIDTLPSKPIKQTRKPKVASEIIKDISLPITISDVVQDIPIPTKSSRKPKVASSTIKPTITRKKSSLTSYSTIANTTPQLVHKEVSLPTHIETKLDKIDSNEYSIQYIKLTLFDANGTLYFRDATKNKLYKKIKDATIGTYVGRWNPATYSIITDIPDSDDETQ